MNATDERGREALILEIDRVRHAGSSRKISYRRMIRALSTVVERHRKILEIVDADDRSIDRVLAALESPEHTEVARNGVNPARGRNLCLGA